MINIKHILCPTDLSPSSDEALRYAVALARTFEARLSVLTWAEDLAPVKTLARLETNESLKKSVAHALSAHLPFGDIGELNWEFILAEGHGPAEAISGEASDRGVDLIVMRSRRRPVAAALLGSIAEEVTRLAPCSVLITHPQEREWVGASTGEIGLGSLLVAHDFSDYAELALNQGLALAQGYQAELHLLHVCAPPVADGPEIAWSPAAAEGVYQQAARRLQKSVPPEAYLWCEIKTAVRWGKPCEEVLAYAEENKIDLICIGAHGGGWGVRTLLGSNVDRVLRRAPCPVLVARPAEVASASEMKSGC